MNRTFQNNQTKSIKKGAILNSYNF
jgi:hypothetical protein